MGNAVFADDTCAVETEHDGETLDSDVMNNVVVSALHEGGVNVAERD